MKTQIEKSTSDAIRELEEAATKYQNKTLRGVMKNKALGYVEGNPIKHLLGRAAWFGVFAILVVGGYWYESMIEIFAALLAWHGGFFLRAIVAGLTVYFRKPIYFAFKASGVFLRDKVIGFHDGSEEDETDGQACLGSVGKDDLVSFLHDERNLNIRNFLGKFPETKRADLLAVIKNLQSRSILVKGENNSNILNEEFDFGQIENYIMKADEIDDLRTLFMVVRDGRGYSFTESPSETAREIRIATENV